MRFLRFLIACLPALAFFGLLAAAAAIGYHFGLEHQHSETEEAADPYTCSMHPQVRQNGPGTCPICRMALEPVGATSEDGRVRIDPIVVQNMGVRIEHAARGPMPSTLRAVGILREDETRLRDITLKFGGFLESLVADTVGMTIEAGMPLFTIYSPELVVAQEELIAARKSGNADLLDAARTRLLLWDLSESLIDRLQMLDRAERTLSWPSPIGGIVLARDVVQGAAVSANQRILRIVDLDRLWLDAQVSESQFGAIRLGQHADVQFVAYPDRTVSGEVVFIAPAIDPRTRTALVRLELANDDKALLPGMFARLTFATDDDTKRLHVDRDAVLSTGKRHLVWLARDGGRFEPRLVTIGRRGDDGRLEITSGLEDGDPVVVSGQFLIDSESRLSGGLRMLDDEGLITDAEHVPPPPAIDVEPAVQARIDAILRAYLQVTTAFAADRDDEAGWVALGTAAAELADAAPGALVAQATALRDAIAVEANDLAARRAVLPKISAAAIAIFRVARPSESFGEQLHVYHCPMAPIDWVQLGPELRNPFYGSEMLECGEQTGLLPLRDEATGRGEGGK